MSENYQAVYDAVRSRIGNIGDAIREACRGLDASNDIYIIREQFCATANEMARPCVLFRPSIGMDGNMWCALYGSNLMEGVAGFGRSPEEAMADFDKNWRSHDAHKIKTEQAREEAHAKSQFGVGA